MASPGRKKLPIDPQQVENLAARGLTLGQVADAMGVSEPTLSRRRKENDEIDEAYKRGKAKGIGTVANALFEKAKAGDTTACIFYLKAQANWRDRVELTGAGGGPIQLSVTAEDVGVL